VVRHQTPIRLARFVLPLKLPTPDIPCPPNSNPPFIANLQSGDFFQGAIQLFALLGYKSERTASLSTRSPEELRERFDPDGKFRPNLAHVARWEKVDLLFQLADAEVKDALSGQSALFQSSGKAYNGKIIQSYLFFALELSGENWNRGDLAAIVREINRLFPMPALVLFRHGGLASLGVINRRLNKTDSQKDVLEKVTLIKDIRLDKPHRAHLEILNELALENLRFQNRPITNFVELDAAWRATLDISALNKRFYEELSDWYFWARREMDFPALDKNDEAALSLAAIRLITRTLFCWFIREKGLVPDELFEPLDLEKLLKNFRAKNLGSGDSYYRAVLQNLFFATLNTPRDDPQRPRKFRSKSENGRDGNRGIHNVLRYENEFHDPQAALSLFDGVPFLNGGLFECLDVIEKGKLSIRYDGYSDNPKEWARLSDALFFGHDLSSPQINARLNQDYGTEPKAKPKTYKVQGLFDIFRRFKFTVDENTPLEEEIALDPELLGQAFENLLASYNEDTKLTARKKTGAFYTPREVVDFMVAQALATRLEAKAELRAFPDLSARLHRLFGYEEENNPFDAPETQSLIQAIDALKVLDPACGSGAFPMSVLNHLVRALGKLDPANAGWKARQIQRARQIEDDKSREMALDAIERNFSPERSFNDYGRKIYLIQNAIYGVDVQPVAVQIAKLRFFISLVIDQKYLPDDINFGIEPLPNLETNIVAANSLLSLPNRGQLTFRTPEIDDLEAQLKEVRRSYFLVRTPATKEKLRADDKRLRLLIKDELLKNSWPKDIADELAQWDFCNPHIAAAFFDAEWMFNFPEAFDCVLTNPPYVKAGRFFEISGALKTRYTCHTGSADLYVYFYEMALRSLKPGGTLCFISSNKYFRSGYGEKLRGFLNAEGRVRSVIDFGDAPVFEAIAYPSIITVSRRDPDFDPDWPVRAMNWEEGPPIESFPELFAHAAMKMERADLKPDGWRFEDKTTLQLLETLRKRGVALGDYVDGHFYYGIKTGLNEAFVIDAETRARLIAQDAKSADLIKPFLRGRDVKRWTVNSPNLFLIFTRRGVKIENYPAIKAHLEQFRPQLEPGIKGGRKAGSYRWFEIQDNVAYWAEFEKPKIIVPAITDKANYGIDICGFYSNDKTSICVTEEYLYVGAVLNSMPAAWCIEQTAATRQGGFLEFKPMYVSQIPIPNADESQRAAIEMLAEYCIALKESKTVGATVQLGFWEQTIDALVFELFVPDEFATSNRAAFETVRAARLPRLETLGDDTPAQLGALEAHFERVYSPKHPLRELVFFLDSLPSARIMLGK